MSDKAPTRTEATTDLALALLLTIAAGMAASGLATWLVTSMGLPLVSIALIQGVLILAGLHALLAHRGLPWRTLRLVRPRLHDFGRGVLALLLVFALNALVSLLSGWFRPELLQSHQEGLAGVAGLLAGGLPTAAVAASMLFVGFYEEALARGFLLVRAEAVLPGRWPPILLSSVLFGLGHFYQGPLGVLQTTLLGILFAHLVLRWQSLWPVIFAHAALNTLSLIVLRELPRIAN